MTYMYVYQYYVLISFEGHCIILVSRLADFSQVKHTHSDTHTELEMQSLTIIIAVKVVQKQARKLSVQCFFYLLEPSKTSMQHCLLRPHILGVLGF